MVAIKVIFLPNDVVFEVFTKHEVLVIHILIHSDTSSVIFPRVTGCFGSRNIIPPYSGHPAKADQTLARV